jgi:hypothetical protein
MPDPSKNQPTFHINQVGNINTSDVTIQGDQIGIQHNHPTIAQPPNSLQSASPTHTILILSASPTDRLQHRIDQEVREIDQGLRLAKHRDRFTLHSCWAVCPDDLRRAMLDLEPQIVHFCGTSEAQNGILLENQSGTAQLVTPEALADLFKLFADRGLACVILNACYSQAQAEAIAQHIPYVIGMSAAILDTTARNFAVGFYDALGAGWSYEQAYEMGKSAIALDGMPQSQIPILKQKARNS